MADTDLADLRKQCITSLYLCSDNISKYLDEEKEAEFAKLKSYVQDYCVLEAREEVAKQALDKAKRETDASNVDELQDKVTGHVDSLVNKQLNVANHPFVLDINRRIQRGMQETRNNLDESEIAITQSEEILIDPITKRPIEDPVRNTQCSHVYERAAITQLITRNRKTKCPVAGCGNRQPIEPAHLVTDDELKFRLTLTSHSTMLQQDPLALDDTL